MAKRKIPQITESEGHFKKFQRKKVPPIPVNSKQFEKYWLILKERDEPEKPSTWEVIWYLIGKTPTILRLLYNLFHVIDRLQDMKDKKTTWIATIKVILGIITLILGLFKIAVPEDISTAVIGLTGSLYMLFSWIQGFFSKDKDKEDEKNTTNP